MVILCWSGASTICYYKLPGEIESNGICRVEGLAGFVFQKRFKPWLNCDGRGPQLVDIITNCQVKLYEPVFTGFKDWQDLSFKNVLSHGYTVMVGGLNWLIL